SRGIMLTQQLPLSGYRVIDFTSMMAGPYCSRWLADQGADVVKVEALEGDYMRTRPPFSGESSAYFGHLNAGKRSIALDLKSSEHRRLAQRLIEAADVLLESFRPGVMARLGLDYESVRELNPRLVYCSISGWGQSGPRAGQAAY